MTRLVLTALLTAGGTALLAPGTLPASAAAAVPIRPIPCGATGELAKQISALDHSGTPGQIYLAKDCTYDVTAANHTSTGGGSTGFPDITGNITIAGQGSTIERAATGEDFRLFEVQPGATLEIRDLILSGGQALGAPGGAILDSGTLTLIDANVRANAASIGGGIFVASGASAAIGQTSIDLNTASDIGGGIASAGTTDITDSAITGNTADAGGAGLADLGGSATTITSGTITDNNTQTGPAGILQTSDSITVSATTTITGNAPANCLGSPSAVPTCTS